ncbi:MAG: hypothetical protein R2681_08295 [Pyrinomonadaceae bacterium]
MSRNGAEKRTPWQTRRGGGLSPPVSEAKRIWKSLPAEYAEWRGKKRKLKEIHRQYGER